MCSPLLAGGQEQNENRVHAVRSKCERLTQCETQWNKGAQTKAGFCMRTVLGCTRAFTSTTVSSFKAELGVCSVVWGAHDALYSNLSALNERHWSYLMHCKSSCDHFAWIGKKLSCKRLFKLQSTLSITWSSHISFFKKKTGEQQVWAAPTSIDQRQLSDQLHLHLRAQPWDCQQESLPGPYRCPWLCLCQLQMLEQVCNQFCFSSAVVFL